MSEETIVGSEAEIGFTILSASAVRQALTECAKAFHAAGQGGVHLRFDTSGGILKRIGAGESPDLAASSLDAIEELHGKGRLVAAPVVVGTSRIALGIRKGEAAPDISTLEAFKATMLAAKSIARGDPAGGGTAGNYLYSVLDRLGLIEPTKDKTVLRVGGYKVMQEVAEQRADFGLTQSTEIAAVAGVEIGAWLPADIQLTTAYALAPTAQGLANGKAQAFLAFLRGPQGIEIFKRCGFAGL